MAQEFPLAETDGIGKYLQQEYGPPKPPNTHIGCFYISLGHEISKSPMTQPQAIDTLNGIPGLTIWGKTEPGIIFLINPEATAPNERVREADINETIRLKLITKLRELHKNYYSPLPIHIMFSRACLYTDEDNKRASSHEITTENIGEIIKSVYENDAAGNTHIEYFYLFVQAVLDGEIFQINDKDVNVHSGALEELKTLLGDWKSVEPRATWPGTFFGYFPKEMQPMTEREREKILNGEVRMPLIKRLEAKLLNVTPRGGSKIKIKVIITRACKYTS